MGISSLGVGSSILTQDVIDQLKAADNAKFVSPITSKITAEEKKQDDLEVIDAHMSNLIDSINELKDTNLYDERDAEITGTSVGVTAASGSDLQDFSLEVVTLATKQIEQSGTFTASDAKIAGAGTSGTFDVNINGVSVANIAYDDTTSLTDLKNLINDNAGDKVSATIIQISDTDFRLFVSSVETGESQDISMTDNGTGLDANLTTGLSAIQTGENASLKFNNQLVSRASNSVDDLVSGLTIELKEVGTSQVSINQNRETIIEKFDSFIEKYNETVSGIASMTTSSESAEGRGSFSSESTVKNMLSTIQNMIQSVGGGVGSLMDYGFDVDQDGVMSIDKDVLNAKMDADPKNVEVFFAGGTFDNGDGTTTDVDGAFTEYATKIEEYTKYDATLDLLKESISDSISTLEDRKEITNTRLESKYEIMAKRFAAYDLMISKISSASSMFVEMANAQTAASS